MDQDGIKFILEKENFSLGLKIRFTNAKRVKIYFVLGVELFLQRA